MKGCLFIVSSPSGGGKGTLIRRVLKELDDLVYSVSFTTRDMRAGETDGVEYNFITVEEFERHIEGNDLLEYALVHGNYYGTSLKQIEDATEAGKDIILEIDVQGAESVRKKRPEAVSIFILPPSFEVLASRLAARGTETAEQLETRLRNAREEIRSYERSDYVIINDDLEAAVGDLGSVILAERVRRDRQMERVRGILDSFGS